jgi:hypothetical protein
LCQRKMKIRSNWFNGCGWDLYERNEILNAVDVKLDGAFDEREAVWLMVVALFNILDARSYAIPTQISLYAMNRHYIQYNIRIEEF